VIHEQIGIKGKENGYSWYVVLYILEALKAESFFINLVLNSTDLNLYEVIYRKTIFKEIHEN
jgi:hypothetical protein